jgi:prepilin-type N-terminal cleavage/methylation domain-containing protein
MGVASERGFTLIELMIVLAIIAVVLAIAFNEYRNMQARGNEASALSSMRSIAAAQAQFAMTCGNLKYAVSLPALGQPVPTTGEPFLSPDLTSAETIEKSGYAIHMAGKPLNDAQLACNNAAVADGYAATADPLRPGITGFYYYGVNTDRVLYSDEEKSYKDDLAETGGATHGQEVKVK